MELLCHLMDTKQKSPRHPLCDTALEKMGLFNFLGVQLLSLPLIALQFYWSSISVRGTVQFYQCARHSPVLSVCTAQSSFISVHGTAQFYQCAWHSPVLLVCAAQSSFISVRGTVQFYQCSQHSPVLSVCMAQPSFISVHGTVQFY